MQKSKGGAVDLDALVWGTNDHTAGTHSVRACARMYARACTVFASARVPVRPALAHQGCPLVKRWGWLLQIKFRSSLE